MGTVGLSASRQLMAAGTPAMTAMCRLLHQLMSGLTRRMCCSTCCRLVEACSKHQEVLAEAVGVLPSLGLLLGTEARVMTWWRTLFFSFFFCLWSD